MPATLSPDDLKSAVEAGVIDAAQAEKLKAMSAAPNASAPAYADAPLADEMIDRRRYRPVAAADDHHRYARLNRLADLARQQGRLLYCRLDHQFDAGRLEQSAGIAERFLALA